MTVLITAFTTAALMAIMLWYLEVMQIPDALDIVVRVGYDLLNTLDMPGVFRTRSTATAQAT